MVYNAIGLMSGSSLDGLDIVAVEFTEIAGVWTYKVLAADCIDYSNEWKLDLRHCNTYTVPAFLNVHTKYGRYLGQEVNAFIAAHDLTHKIHIIGSHGHTVHHDPAQGTSTQIGDGAGIAAVTGIASVTDLRNKDVTLGGQGAPIVPIAEQYLWSAFDYCLNIGGIANVTINTEAPIAFDIAPANQILNHFAEQLGSAYDKNGDFARKGSIDEAILNELNDYDYYKASPPKSLANSFSTLHIAALSLLTPEDALATACEHIAIQIKNAIPTSAKQNCQMLITGGGAFNSYLIERIQHHLDHITVVLPGAQTINYKEAIAMALIGVLRWREEDNVLHTVTGATQSSVGGALWI